MVESNKNKKERKFKKEGKKKEGHKERPKKGTNKTEIRLKRMTGKKKKENRR